MKARVLFIFALIIAGGASIALWAARPAAEAEIVQERQARAAIVSETDACAFTDIDEAAADTGVAAIQPAAGEPSE